MKYALFIVEDPNALHSKNLALYNFANSVQKEGMQAQQVERLNAGAYVCSLEHGLHALNRLLSEAEAREFRSRTLFFDHDLPWVISEPSLSR